MRSRIIWRRNIRQGTSDACWYNTAMAQIAGLSDIKIPEPLTFILKKDWASATEEEKQIREKKVDDACRAVCRVIAPSSSEELLKSYITRTSRSDNEVEALKLAYSQAPTKSLKTQILSIYALRFTLRELKAIHAPFEKLSDRQIKKARSHAKTVGVGLPVENIPYHRLRIDKSKLEHFLSFVDQPYFYQEVQRRRISASRQVYLVQNIESTRGIPAQVTSGLR